MTVLILTFGKCDGENRHCPDLVNLDAGTPLEVRRKLHLAMLLNGVDYSGGRDRNNVSERWTYGQRHRIRLFIPLINR